MVINRWDIIKKEKEKLDLKKEREKLAVKKEKEKLDVKKRMDIDTRKTWGCSSKIQVRCKNLNNDKKVVYQWCVVSSVRVPLSSTRSDIEMKYYLDKNINWEAKGGTER